MAHGSIPCSGKGTCVNGNCVCRAGFTGTACERSKLDNLDHALIQGSTIQHSHLVAVTFDEQQNVGGIATIMGDAYRCDISQKQHATTNLSNLPTTNGMQTRSTGAYVILDIKVSTPNW